MHLKLEQPGDKNGHAPGHDKSNFNAWYIPGTVNTIATTTTTTTAAAAATLLLLPLLLLIIAV